MAGRIARLYTLAHYGMHGLRIGAVAGTGRVLMLRPDPGTTDDLHPTARKFYPGLYHPSAEFINSSVTQFVEVCWRWHAAGEPLSELQLDEPGGGRPRQEHEAWFNRLQDCERIILERIDGHFRASDTGTPWAEVTLLTHAGN